ncbi:MAG: FAD synthetase family protein [Clostridia bacterium]|nr:FAD synthetase family protein [Clostridia bacterium]
MQILKDEREFEGQACSVALGMFDGVHLGHRRLIETAVALARADGILSAVDTFATHPLQVLCPERAPAQLLTNEQRARRMAALGVDVLVMRPFTLEYAAQPPELFLERLCESLRPRHIVVGYNYTFGRRGEGDANLLEELSGRYGYRLTVIEPVTVGGEPVSSTRIRHLLAEGRRAEAEALMGADPKMARHSVKFC